MMNAEDSGNLLLVPFEIFDLPADETAFSRTTRVFSIIPAFHSTTNKTRQNPTHKFGDFFAMVLLR